MKKHITPILMLLLFLGLCTAPVSMVMRGKYILGLISFACLLGATYCAYEAVVRP